MASSGSCPRLQSLTLSALLVLGILLLLYTYQHSDGTLPSLDVFLQAPSLPGPSAPRCYYRQNHSKGSLRSESDPHKTTLLIWTWPFQRKFTTDCEVFGIKHCLLTENRSLYKEADGVFFHHRDINLKDLPRTQRPRCQKWVWMNMEAPGNSWPVPALNKLFNATCNYRRDANIPVPYGYLEQRTSSDPTFQLPKKDKLLCWVVSNWKRHLLRVQYYNQLKDHIKIHSYGSAFRRPLSDSDYRNVVSSCKFYLAFENSVNKDYITEKVFLPMQLGSVPVVLGPGRSSYEQHIPAEAFIHVDDFSSQRDLADRLGHLDSHPEEYQRFFEWTKQSKVTLSWFGKEQACRTCHYLQKHRRPEVVHDLTEWFWS